MSEYIGNDDKNKFANYDKEKLQRFKDTLKKHLTNEYLTLSERKDVLESDATQIKVEIERRDRTLFPANEHSDARKYFSPLNLTDLKDTQKSEKEKELNRKLAGINKENTDIEAKMSEIMDFLRDLDDMISYADSNKELAHDSLPAADSEDVSKEKEPEKEKSIDKGHPGIKIDGNLRKSLNQLTSYYMEKEPPLEILLEYNCHQEEWGMEASRFIITQIGDQIYRAVKQYSISMVLLEVSDQTIDDKKELCLTLSYDCEKTHDIKSGKIVFNYSI